VPIKLLGTVQDGLAVGALVQLVDGSYAQMNGDFMRPLSTSRVEFAINAKLKQASSKTAILKSTQPEVAPVTKPVVEVKRRRQVPSTIKWLATTTRVLSCCFPPSIHLGELACRKGAAQV
jgi:hypothetical protein